MKKREPTGGSWNRKRKIRPLMACLLAAAVVAAAAQIPNVAVKAAPVDLDQECSLKVVPSSDQGFLDDLEGEVAIDLYKVADAVKASGYDTYNFDVGEAYGTLEGSLTYEALSSGEMTNDRWRELAQEAAKAALGAETEALEPDVKAAPAGGTVSGLKAGLYLMVARDADPETGKKELDREPDGSAPSETEGISTRVFTKRYAYDFEPQLVAIPGKPAFGEDGQMTGNNTANAGEWEYDMTATLKPTQTERFGDLKITKTLTSFEAKEPVEPATFVFEVEASRDGQLIYSDVVAATFTGAGTQELTLADRIPVDAQVTVREAYSGAAYTVQGSAEKVFGEGEWLVSADDMLETSFTNTYDEHHRDGHGIVNSFSFDGSEWSWTPEPGQAQAE